MKIFVYLNLCFTNSNWEKTMLKDITTRYQVQSNYNKLNMFLNKLTVSMNLKSNRSELQSWAIDNFKVSPDCHFDAQNLIFSDNFCWLYFGVPRMHILFHRDNRYGFGSLGLNDLLQGKPWFLLPSCLWTVFILTPTKAASNNQEPNRCRTLLHLGLLEAKGIRLSRDRKPGKHWGAGAVALATDVALLPGKKTKIRVFKSSKFAIIKINPAQLHRLA